MTNSLVKGSLAAVAATNGQSLAQTFISCDVIVLVDTSGSMGTMDSLEGQSRYDHACRELATLQSSLPGKIGVISFSARVMFCANGIPFNFKSTTNIAEALKFAKVADIPGAMRFILISDGEPDDAKAALQMARAYANKIDCIYVGPLGGEGRAFLERLAGASGGSFVTAAQAKELAGSVQKLLVA